MTSGGRESLIARIRRFAAVREPSSTQPAGARPEQMTDLEARVAHLEQLVEGLQDCVYRESDRHGALIAELQNQVEPGAMGAAIAEDARSRGL